MHVIGQIPRLRRLEDVGKRWHRGAAETCHEGAENVLSGAPATEIPAFGEICRPDGIVPIVLQIGERRPVTSPLVAMTLPTFGIAIKLLAAGDALSARGDLRRDADGCGRGLVECRREGLDILQDLPPLPL